MILGRLAAGARQAGAETPEVLVVARAGRRPVMLQSALPGRSAAAILADEPQRLPELQQRVAAWIESWNRTTADTKPLTEERLARELVAPARVLAHRFAEGKSYADRVEEHCAAVVGEHVPLVVAHNDLTMSNLFIGKSGRFGVVDWETAREDCLPLADFYYATVDAAAGATRYVDRLRAFRSCFSPKGKNAEAARLIETRLSSVLGLSVAITELCFHACWLHHAVNEYWISAESSGGPFLSIVRTVANGDSVHSFGAVP